MKVKTTINLDKNISETLDRIAQETGLNRSEVIEQIVRQFGDKLRTQYNRRKFNVSDDDFADSPQVAEGRSLLKRLCPWMG